MARRPRRAIEVADAIAAYAADLPAGAPLPTWRELADTHKVSLSTVANAMALLAERGVIHNTGRGATVAARFERDATDITRRVGQWRGFHASAIAAGLNPFTDVLGIEDVPAPPPVAARLAVPAGETVLRRSRLQGITIDAVKQPVQLSASWIIHPIADVIPVLRQLDTGRGGMGSRMEDIGLDLSYAVILSARDADDHEADMLQLPRRPYPLLDVWRQCSDQNGRIVELTRLVINSTIMPLAFGYA